MLRPLEVRDHDAWREIRTRSRDWLERWEPLPEPGTRDPVVDREAFRARCGAWDRQRQFDSAYGFGTFLLDGTLIGEVSLGSVLRGPFQSCFIGYWVDERYAGCGYTPDAVAIVMRYGFEELGLHRMEAAIVPRNSKSRRVRGEARPARRGDRHPFPADPGHVGGPRALRDHPRGVGRAPPRVRGEVLQLARHPRLRE